MAGWLLPRPRLARYMGEATPMKCASCLLSGAIRGLACSLKAGLVLFVGGRWVRAFGCLPSRGGLDRLQGHGACPPRPRRTDVAARYVRPAVLLEHPGLNRLACRGGVTGVPCAWQAFPGGLPYRVPEYVEEAHPTNSTLPGLVPERVGSFEPSRILLHCHALSPRPVPASSGGRRHEDSAPQWAEEELERRQWWGGHSGRA